MTKTEKKEHTRIIYKKRRERLINLGLCVVCGKNKNVPGILRCEVCRQKNINNQKERKEYLKKMGICRICSQANIVEGLTVCEKCRNKDKLQHRNNKLTEEQRKRKSELAKKRYNKRKELGICTACGKNKSIKGETYCLDCKLFHNQSRSGYVEHRNNYFKRQREKNAGKAHLFGSSFL